MSFGGGSADPFAAGGASPAGGGYVDAFQGLPTQDAGGFGGGGMGGGIPEANKQREWETEHEKELEEKAQKEAAEKKARREAAYAEIQKWKDERDTNIKKKASTNREEEE